MYIACVWIFVLFLFPCGGNCALEDIVPLRFTEEPYSETYAVPSKPIILKCRTFCNNCINNVTKYWTKDGYILYNLTTNQRNKDFIQVSNGDLILNGDRRNLNSSYRCFAVYNDVTIVSQIAQVKLASLPSVSVIVAEKRPVLGSIARFQCLHDGAQPSPLPSDIQWYRDDVLLTTNDTQYRLYSNGILHISGISTLDNGVYKCSVTSALLQEMKWSSNVQLTVEDKPKSSTPAFQYLSKDIILIEGKTGIIECFGSGYPLPVVKILKVDEFSREQTLTSGNGAAIFQWKSPVLADVGTYVCEISSDTSVVRRTVSVTVQAPPSFDMPFPSSTTVRPENQPVTLRCPVFGVPLPKVEWYRNGAKLIKGSNINMNGIVINFQRTRMSDSGLYQCFARSHLGSLTYSNYFRVKKAMVGALSAPRNIKAIPLSSKEIAVSWEPPINQSVIAYTVYWKESGSSSWSSVVPVDDGKYTLTRLYGGTDYVVEVQAFSRFHGGLRSKGIEATTFEDAPEMAPSHVALENVGNNSLRVSWYIIPRQFSNGHIMHYHIYYSEIDDGNKKESKQTVAANETDYVLSGLVKGSLYKVEVSSSNAAREGPRSRASTIEIHSLKSIDTKQGELTAIWLNNSAAQVTWNLAPKCMVFEGVTLVYIEIDSTNYWKDSLVLKYAPRIKQATISNIDRKQLYRIELYQNCKGLQPILVSVFVLATKQNRIESRPLPNGGHSTSLSEPLDVKCVVKDASSIYLSWAKPRYGGEYVNYVVKAVTTTLESTEAPLAATINQEFLVKNLQPGSWYYYTIGATTIDSQRMLPRYSDVVTCKTVDTVSTPPLAVTGKLLVEKSTLIVTWDHPEKTNGILLSYVIKYGICDPGLEMTWSNHIVSMVHGMDKPLGAGIKIKNIRDYCLKVYPMNGAGEGGSSKMFEVKAIPVPTSQPNSLLTTTKKITHTGLQINDRKFNSNVLSDDTRMGIIVGCSVASAFLIVFILVFIWKNPFRHGKPRQAPWVMHSCHKDNPCSHNDQCYMQCSTKDQTAEETNKAVVKGKMFSSRPKCCIDKHHTVVELTGNSSNDHQVCICTCLLTHQHKNTDNPSPTLNEGEHSDSTHDSGMQTASSASEERGTPDSTTKILPDGKGLTSATKEQKTSTRVLFHRVQETTFQV